MSHAPGLMTVRASTALSPLSSDTLPCIKTLQKQAQGGGRVSMMHLMPHRYPPNYENILQRLVRSEMLYRKFQAETKSKHLNWSVCGVCFQITRRSRSQGVAFEIHFVIYTV